MQYNYCKNPLENNIKWKPIVLILGNYSSGKSTLINEFIGHPVQNTGQAPTDDCFTVITADDDDPAYESYTEGSIIEERDGDVLLNDPQYPFEKLSQYGEKFSSHFKIKKVKCAALENLAIIDTPGMLDAVTENNRGYEYQKVIGELASLADVVLMLFDAHKAGTIRESYESLKNTLPQKTFENRVIFVLNRIDECSQLEDLIRVYGTLCWNLSQMMGRKDIPRILLSYAPSKQKEKSTNHSFIQLLDNQQKELKTTIMNAPRQRLDHLATYVEKHSYRVQHLLESILELEKKKLRFWLQTLLLGFGFSFFISTLTISYLNFNLSFNNINSWWQKPLFSFSAAMICCSFLLAIGYKYLNKIFQKRSIRQLHLLTQLPTQARVDSWNFIEAAVKNYLLSSKKFFFATKSKKRSSKIRKGFSNRNKKYPQPITRN